MTDSPQGIHAGVSPASCRRPGGRGPSPWTPYPLLRSRALLSLSDPEKNAPDRTPQLGWNPKARQNKQRIRRNDGCIGPSLGEETLAGKASLRWHVDSATQAERLGD